MKRAWWKESIVYQIYPRSFKDTTGNGVGDLQGIVSELDTLRDLGVDVIWLSPVYESPNDDNGYDIADYRAIMAEFGTMEDFDEMLDGIHARGMRLIMDLVANHTSDEHAWFTESRASLDSPKRDYYIWRKGRTGPDGESLPPNNWRSFFSGPAWEFDEATGEYYLHLFTRKQPDLNWENPAVRREISDVVEFWLKKGVDGFRMDVISLISKRGYDDTPHTEFNDTIANVYANGPRVHEFLQEMVRDVISRYDVMTVGEGPGIGLAEGPLYVNEDRGELNMVFHFGHMFMDHGKGGKFDPVDVGLPRFKKVFEQWDRAMAGGGWNSLFLGNHDFPRMVSRFGDDGEHWWASARALCLMLMSMRGTPYVYQGDEIGMTNVAFPSIEDYRDVETLNAWREEVLEGGRDPEDFLRAVHRQGRDNARTPYQWSEQPDAGFTASGRPWITVNPNFPRVNLASQRHDPDSIWAFYRRMIAFRKAHPVLIYGEFTLLEPDHEALFAFERVLGGDAAAALEGDGGSGQEVSEQALAPMLVVVNCSASPLDYTYASSSGGWKVGECVMGNLAACSPWIDERVTLAPWEAQIVRLTAGG